MALFRLYNSNFTQFARTCKLFLHNSHMNEEEFLPQFLNKEIPPLYGEEQREIKKRKDEEK